jgi:hypothetical protein
MYQNVAISLNKFRNEHTNFTKQEFRESMKGFAQNQHFLARLTKLNIVKNHKDYFTFTDKEKPIHYSLIEDMYKEIRNKQNIAAKKCRSSNKPIVNTIQIEFNLKFGQNDLHGAGDAQFVKSLLEYIQTNTQ